MAKDLSEIVFEQRSDMGDSMLNVVTIRTDEAAQGHILIPNLEVAPFAKQMFDELHLRAFAEIISGGFETKPQDGDVLFPRIEYDLDRAPQMLIVAGHDRFEKRQSQIQLLGPIIQGTHILRETGTAKGKAGLQIAGRDVQLTVGS